MAPTIDKYTGPDRRSVERNDELVQAVIVAVRAEVAEKAIPDGLHREHHAFMSAWIAEQERKKAIREKIKAQVGGWALITILGGVGKGAWELWVFAKDHWK